MPTDDTPPAWKLWAGSTAVLVVALVASPSEVDNGDICPRPAGWLIVHPARDNHSADVALHNSCNDAAPKRGLAAGGFALLGAGITLTSRRRQQPAAPGPRA